MIDVRVFGSPEACWTAADEVLSVADALATVGADVRQQRSRSIAAWEGDAGDRFRAKVETWVTDLDDLQQHVRPAADALGVFGTQLRNVQLSMEAAKDAARAAGLQVTDQAIVETAALRDGITNATPAQLQAFDELKAQWTRIAGMVETARAQEQSAHDALGDALEQAAGDGWLAKLLQGLGFQPPSSGGTPALSLWALGAVGTGAGMGADWMTKAKYGRFQPIGPDGRVMSPKGLTAAERFKYSMGDKNWRAEPGKSVVRGRWSTGGKWVGRVGTVVAGAAAGYDQWVTDSDDPSLGTDERIGRATTQAVTTGAGAWGGAYAGGSAGAAIGSMIAPGPGTVIGGAVGGIVGGFAGSAAGGWVGDKLVGVGGDVAEAITFWD
ncbi:WXG100 family type VII secretion target [Spongisporangium articulatum]|uniref:WXG100 family type VII secretion target n=1 Tax=Spongisporangium articulatum TaxID=3362603 RepID=A0ABW8ALA2_9ACTN